MNYCGDRLLPWVPIAVPTIDCVFGPKTATDARRSSSLVLLTVLFTKSRRRLFLLPLWFNVPQRPGGGGGMGTREKWRGRDEQSEGQKESERVGKKGKRERKQKKKEERERETVNIQ